jgi:hypothetical protein
MARKRIKANISHGSEAFGRVLTYLEQELSLPPNCREITVRMVANQPIEVEVSYWPPELEPPEGQEL